MAADMCFPPKLVEFSLVPLLTRQNSMLGLEAVSLVSDIWAGLLRISESNLPGPIVVPLFCWDGLIQRVGPLQHRPHIMLGDLTRNHHIMEAQNEFYSVHPHIPAVSPMFFSDC